MGGVNLFVRVKNACSNIVQLKDWKHVVFLVPHLIQANNSKCNELETEKMQHVETVLSVSCLNYMNVDSITDF